MNEPENPGNFSMFKRNSNIIGILHKTGFANDTVTW